MALPVRVLSLSSASVFLLRLGSRMNRSILSIYRRSQIKSWKSEDGIEDGASVTSSSPIGYWWLRFARRRSRNRSSRMDQRITSQSRAGSYTNLMIGLVRMPRDDGRVSGATSAADNSGIVRARFDFSRYHHLSSPPTEFDVSLCLLASPTFWIDARHHSVTSVEKVERGIRPGRVRTSHTRVARRNRVAGCRRSHTYTRTQTHTRTVACSLSRETGLLPVPLSFSLSFPFSLDARTRGDRARAICGGGRGNTGSTDRNSARSMLITVVALSAPPGSPLKFISRDRRGTRFLGSYGTIRRSCASSSSSSPWGRVRASPRGWCVVRTRVRVYARVRARACNVCHRRRVERRCKTAECCVELSWLRQSRATTGTAATGTGAASLSRSPTTSENPRRAVQWRSRGSGRENPPRARKTAATAALCAPRSPVGELLTPRRVAPLLQQATPPSTSRAEIHAPIAILYRAIRSMCASSAFAWKIIMTQKSRIQGVV